ncbi:hypothetical protein [Aquimarina spongiae]|uniref:Uncharacterized protein n=1 Tax=Aquimarina spongiae TaxID=570521 RepID=A0A1M6EFX3_9FLAO|nr:hypothetical protein [Aquimarina spongiae]SHI84341.1 hypothetical protein SAMN04488508_103389 [Aquimarina spongiae]
MSKKKLDELLGLEMFDPIKAPEKIRGGECRKHVIGDTTITFCDSGIIRILVRE